MQCRECGCCSEDVRWRDIQVKPREQAGGMILCDECYYEEFLGIEMDTVPEA